jgi:hypothetical protein
VELESHHRCYYCHLLDKNVEAGGMWYCPNPFCRGPGASWFRAKLKSYHPDATGHWVDEGELNTEAAKYCIENSLPYFQYSTVRSVLKNVDQMVSDLNQQVENFKLK